MAGIARALVSSARTAAFASVTRRPTQLASQSRVISTSWTLQCQAVGGPPKQMITPTEFDKTSLVKAKIYATREDIPETVSSNKIKRARDWMRIRISLIMMGVAALSSLVMMKWGRRDRDRGASLSQIGMDKQTKLREQGIHEAEAKDKESS